MSAEAGLSVLVVDDDAVLLKAAARILSRHADTTTADCAARARELLEQRRFDIVVSDYAMPGEDGLSLLAWVRERFPDTLLVLFSGADIEKGEVAARDGHIHHAVSKDSGYAGLAEIVRGAKPITTL
jgi:CheY-like chemotaxis protein